MTATAAEGVGESAQQAYSAKELSVRWGCSKRTIQLLMARGDLPAFWVGRTRVALVRDVEAHEENRHQT